MFSNQFLVAALLQVINAPSLQQMRAGKEILHERAGRDLPQARRRRTRAGNGQPSDEEKDREGDPELVSTEGTVDGGIFRFRAAHFEWLLGVGEGLGLGFDDMGKRRHGRPATLHFCDELQRLYGNEDAQVAEGASFAVENWAAAGFWQELEDGLMTIKQPRHPAAAARVLHLAQPRRGPARRPHAWRSWRRSSSTPTSTASKFFQGGREVLDAIAASGTGWKRSRRRA